MARLAIRGHSTRGREVIELLEILGGKNDSYPCSGEFINNIYYINDFGYINSCHKTEHPDLFYNLTLEEFEDKFPYKIGDKVKTIHGKISIVEQLDWCKQYNTVSYELEDDDWLYYVNELQLYNKEEDKGNISDGYHTFNELYEYRLLYQASLFNEFAKQGLYDVHKSKRHSDGSIPFGDENWFIVQAELPTGQISNHYEMKNWDLFDIPIKDKANPYDGHTPQDVTERIRKFLTPKYPKTYKECCDILGFKNRNKTEQQFLNSCDLYDFELMSKISMLKVCRDTYWKIAGEEMGLGKPWEPDWSGFSDDSYPTITKCNDRIVKTSIYTHDCILVFPTEEIREAFYENFKELIDFCKELL